MAGTTKTMWLKSFVKALLGGVSLSTALLFLPAAAHATTHHTAVHHATAGHAVHVAAHHATAHSHHASAHRHYVYRHHHVRTARYRHSGLQCVPYAREVSHVELTGDAYLWWAEASERYARGAEPQAGAVLAFRPIHRMPLGHVAVVTAVVDSRTILVTQANWLPGTITNDVTVEDVSDNNDWSEVQVELGDTTTLGAPYPVYGFIYNHPDTGTVIASGTAGPAPEVAEAPPATLVSSDAPNRNLQ